MENHTEASWFLGVDLGTGSCKTVVIDEDARILGLGAGEYAARGVQEKWQEQDPESVLAGMVASVRNALQEAGSLPGECAGMSIGGALHSLMAVDAHGAPVSGVMTWADGRAMPQAKQVRRTQDAGALYRQTGCPVHGMYPLYKIRWLRENLPEAYSRAAHFLSAKEYVVQRLTGEYVVDYSLAAGSGLLDTHRLAWNETALELAGARRQQLSSLAASTTILPGIDPQLARQMGLAPSTRLILGASDAANSHLGSGAAGPHQATCMVGTSGAMRVIAPRPILDGSARTWCYAIDERHWLVGGAINNGGIALSWLRDLLNGAFPVLAPDQQLSFGDLLALAADAPLGADGLICLPFFAGERSPGWNPDSQAVFFGLNLNHELRHIARALLEGIAFRMLSLKEILAEIIGGLDELCASGGYTHSPFWLQLMSSALDSPLRIPACGETSAIGAAFWALLGAGALPSIEAMPAKAPIAEQVEPDPAQAERYRLVYNLYQQLYESASGSFAQLAELKAKLSSP